ncbi:MAG: adenylate/guanylate cyclase domain-containing protein [Pseudomonadota bacterium]
MSLLYADIRKSTEFTRAHSPAEVSARINTFLDLATKAITDEDGFIVAFYGDCVVANWPPGFSGPDFIAQAGRAGLAVAKASAKAGIPVGIGLHSGRAYMASVHANRGGFRDVSIFGEEVNLVARLSSAAAAGEVVMTAEVAAAIGAGEAQEALTLKGFDENVKVLRDQSCA